MADDAPFTKKPSVDHQPRMSMKEWTQQNVVQGVRALAAIPRTWLGTLLGTAGGTRDPYTTFGWDRSVTPQMLWEMYVRGGIARRIVHAYPDNTWFLPPEVTATQGWTKAFEKLAKAHHLWSILSRADKLSQLGQYSIILIGTRDSNLEAPLKPRPDNEIIFLQPYSDRTATIAQYGMDSGNERFGLPVLYQINPGAAALEDRQMFSQGQGPNSTTRATPPNQFKSTFKVHWSRVIHICQGGLESQVFGTPILWAIWNYLTDLQKVTGGSAESYWITANRGINANVDKDAVLDPADEAALSEEIEEYFNGIRRFIRTRGVEVKSLGQGVANPKGPFETLITLIAGTTGIPQRILLGSESGHLGSTQDKGNWADRVEAYREMTAWPSILLPALQAFMRIGALPTVDEDKIKALWPPAYTMSPLEKGQQANQTATALNNIGLANKNMKGVFSKQEVRTLVGLPEEMKGDPIEVQDPPQPVVKPGAPAGPGGPTGGVPKSGNGSGDAATPGSDSNGQGAPPQGRKATNP